MTMPPSTHLPRTIECVVVGASAGGFEALQRVTQALPAGFAPALLAVLHLPPERPSRIAPLLAARCRCPVTEAVDKQPILPGHVIIAPPDYHMLVERGGTVALSIDPPVLLSRPAIDPLFESAALVYGPRLLALLLTGASSDGTAGLATVRRRGGLAWVQEPEDARMPMMPASALQHCGADAVLTLNALCLRLAGDPAARP